MHLERDAAKSGIWFGLLRSMTQLFSWIITVAIARILSPEDYGLMSIAGVFTGFVEVFSELGLGAAIVQREKVNQRELSSNFWFSLLIGVGFASVCFSLAFLTGWVFKEPRVVTITQAISAGFIIGSLMIVPFNILVRDLRFKAIGMIQLLAVVISTCSMLWMANQRFGVWTLVWGNLINRTFSVLMVFYVSKWMPSLSFKFVEVKSFLNFGLNVAGSRFFFYMFQKFDILIVGKLFGPQNLGYYSFAMQLASIPTDKIVAVINQVSFPLFSKFQNNLSKIQDLYLRISKYVVLIVSPLYLSGVLFGNEIIIAILGEKWAPAAFLFRMFCLSQFVVSVTLINNVVQNSLGRSRSALYFHLILAASTACFILWAAQYGFNFLWIPWVTIYPAIYTGWMLLTLKQLKISYYKHLMNFVVPFLASTASVISIWLAQNKLNLINFSLINYHVKFAQGIFFGITIYVIFLILFERRTISEIWDLRKNRS